MSEIVTVGLDLAKNVFQVHEPADAGVANVQTQLFQFFRHSRTAVAAQAETRLFFYVSQNDYARPLPLAGRSARSARHQHEIRSSVSVP